MNKLKILVISIRIGLGCLFIYAGIQKFIPKPPPPATETAAELPDHVVKIKAYIGGLKQTGYFWPMLGVAELAAGVLLVSQVLSLLGAVILLPVTLNIFLFHAFLTPHEVGETVLTGLYFTANLFLIGYGYPQLKPAFLNFKS